MGRPLLVYSLLRIALFVAGYLLALAGGLRGPLALLAGLLVSAVVSFLFLKKQRDRIAEAADGRRRDRLAERERLQARLREDG